MSPYICDIMTGSWEGKFTRSQGSKQLNLLLWLSIWHEDFAFVATRSAYVGKTNPFDSKKNSKKKKNE